MTSIRFSSTESVIESVVHDLRLPRNLSEVALIGAVARRLGSFMCPSSRSELSRAVIHSLRGLLDDVLLEPKHVKAIVEQMIVGGDFVEVTQTLGLESHDHSSRIVCAPPSFVVIGRCIFLFGVATDDASFLPDDIGSIVDYDGVSRVIRDQAVDALANRLVGNGLRQVHYDTWLRRSSFRTPRDLLAKYERHLKLHGTNGDRQGIRILLPHGTGLSYADRWKEPTVETGLFIGRTPQTYGEPLWLVAELTDGLVSRSARLPIGVTNERACDQAWHFQLASDAVSGNPSTFSIQEECLGKLLSIHVPIPLAASRRLVYLGGARQVNQIHRNYWVPSATLDEVAAYLRSDLWLAESAS